MAAEAPDSSDSASASPPPGATSPPRPAPAGTFLLRARLPLEDAAARVAGGTGHCGTGAGRTRHVIRLLLADDEHLIRSAVAAPLGVEPDLTVVAQAASGSDALAMARLHRPDVAVLDLQMPYPDGITVAERLRDQLPDCASIIVTSHRRPGHLKRALAAGVRGFLPKTVSALVLADVIRSVHGGGRYVDPELAAAAISAGENPLTSREADILELAADGLRVDDIARRVSPTSGTVRYLSSAVAKIGADNRHDAVNTAREHGWI